MKFKFFVMLVNELMKLVGKSRFRVLISILCVIFTYCLPFVYDFEHKEALADVVDALAIVVGFSFSVLVMISTAKPQDRDSFSYIEDKILSGQIERMQIELFDNLIGLTVFGIFGVTLSLVVSVLSSFDSPYWILNICTSSAFIFTIITFLSMTKNCFRLYIYINRIRQMG